MVEISLHIENINTLECSYFSYNDEDNLRYTNFLTVSLTGFKILSQTVGSNNLYNEYKFADGWRICELYRRVSNE